MTGWKTKTGVIIGVIGGAMLASADMCPSPTWIPWLKFAGTLMAAAGGGLGIYGVGKKIDRQGK